LLLSLLSLSLSVSLFSLIISIEVVPTYSPREDPRILSSLQSLHSHSHLGQE
jgi:hypothetical protein